MQKTKIPIMSQIAKLKSIDTAVGVKSITILSATLALFYEDLIIILNDALGNEDTSHILLIPLIFTYLVYRKRKMLRAVIPFEGNQTAQTKLLTSLSGILLSLAAVLFYWYGSYTFTPLEYHMMALPVFVSGLIMLFFNLRTLGELAFPILFLLFLMPPPSEILYNFGSTLSIVSSEASNLIVNVFGIRSTIISEYGNPTIIITRPDQTNLGFTVDVACSGIYSLMGFFVFSMFIAYITRDKTWKKASIFLIGLPLIYALNIIRITIILILGYQYGEALALQVFHLLGGWTLIFIGTIALLQITEKVFKLKLFQKSKSQLCPKCNPIQLDLENTICYDCGKLLKNAKNRLQKLDAIKIAIITVILLLLLSIQAPVFALTENPAEVILSTPAGEQTTTSILPEVPEYNSSFVQRDRGFEEKTGQDASLIYIYKPIGNSTQMVIYIGIEISSARSLLHRWETCLVNFYLVHGYQPKVTELDLRDVQIMQNPPVIGRYFVFKYNKYNMTQAVLYWYETSTFSVNGTSQQKQVKISVIAYPDDKSEIPAVEDQLLVFATAISSHWQPIKTWSPLTMAMSKNGDLLMSVPLTLLISFIAYSSVESRKQKKNMTKLVRQLTRQDQQIVEAALQTQKYMIPTFANIMLTYSKISGKTVEPDYFIEKLDQASELKFINKELRNQIDEPILTWKINILKI